MPIKELKLENTIYCSNCKKVYVVEDWTPADTLNAKCPNCKQKKLYWAVKTREERINKEVEEYGEGR